LPARRLGLKLNAVLMVLAIAAAAAWVVFALMAARTLAWLAFNREAEAKRRRGAVFALVALGAALVLAAARFIMSFT
jgi:hypothetical protein